MRILMPMLLIAGAISACTPPGPYAPAGPRAGATAERPCYRTLGVVDCHAAPLPGEENRRVGFFDAAAAFRAPY